MVIVADFCSMTSPLRALIALIGAELFVRIVVDEDVVTSAEVDDSESVVLSVDAAFTSARTGVD